MVSVVKVTVAQITDQCPFYREGDTFLIRQQCFDPALATPRQFCMHSLKDIYDTYMQVRRGPIGGKERKGCRDKGKALFVLVKAGAFTDEHDVGILRTFTRHGAGPSLAQDARLASTDFFIEIGEFRQALAPFLLGALALHALRTLVPAAQSRLDGFSTNRGYCTPDFT